MNAHIYFIHYIYGYFQECFLKGGVATSFKNSSQAKRKYSQNQENSNPGEELGVRSMPLAL